MAAREEIGLGWELSWSPQIPRDPGTGPYSYSLWGSVTRSPSPWSNEGGRLGPWGPQLMYSWGTSPPLGMPTKLLSILFLSTSREGTPPSQVSPRSRQGWAPFQGAGPLCGVCTLAGCALLTCLVHTNHLGSVNMQIGIGWVWGQA